jgi:hypothetical protein
LSRSLLIRALRSLANSEGVMRSSSILRDGLGSCIAVDEGCKGGLVSGGGVGRGLGIGFSWRSGDGSNGVAPKEAFNVKEVTVLDEGVVVRPRAE